MAKKAAADVQQIPDGDSFRFTLEMSAGQIVSLKPGRYELMPCGGVVEISGVQQQPNAPIMLESDGELTITAASDVAVELRVLPKQQ